MGGDGGSIPGRRDLVRERKRAEMSEKELELHIKWRMCQLTQERLKEPIVVDERGRLYSKEAIIEAILEKKNIEKCPHIRSLKDVKELNLTLNPVYEDKPDVGGTGTFKDWNVTPWICPVVGLEMNGKHRFCVIWDCGCVISEKALLEVKSDVCHKCAKPFEKLGVLIINGNDEENAEFQDYLKTKRTAAKSARKAKKDEKSIKIEADSDGKPTTSTSASTSMKIGEKRKKESLDKEKDKESAEKRSKTIQGDPNASKVYKSLFTTCDEAKNKPKAHWVTHANLYF